jgi:hypothetical protein
VSLEESTGKLTTIGKWTFGSVIATTIAGPVISRMSSHGSGVDHIGLLIIAIGIVILCGILYFKPTILAHRRGHSQTTAIFCFNLLLGWVFLGWIIALVWAAGNSRVIGFPPVGGPQS